MVGTFAKKINPYHLFNFARAGRHSMEHTSAWLIWKEFLNVCFSYRFYGFSMSSISSSLTTDNFDEAFWKETDALAVWIMCFLYPSIMS